ncbi:peptide chain release factor 2 [Thermodesulfobacteriota bacterium]
MINFKGKVAELQKKISDLRNHLDVDKKIERIKELDKIASENDFWNDNERAQKVLKERAQHEKLIESITSILASSEEVSEYYELAEAEEDSDAIEDASTKLNELVKEVEHLELQRLFSSKDDFNNAIVSINAGAGGTEAQDWAEMLLRMYARWAERLGFKTEINDMQADEEAGFKSAVFTLTGDYAYGNLRSEIGIHRLVRISPFDTSSRRHTSFASVSVTPEIDDDIVIDIEEKDLRIDTYRASGAGGQHVNKTDSAVRITHIPTHIVVQCQSQRSQHKNKTTAIKILKSKLYELELSKQEQERDNMQTAKKEIAWGSQIRSYTLQPYRLVKDHRTNMEIGDVDSVLNGNIDGLIRAFLLLKD